MRSDLEAGQPDLVITRQTDSTSGHRFKLDYQNLFRTTWKKLPHDVKFSGNSWSMAELLMERPQVSFDCLPEFVGHEIYLVVSSPVPDLTDGPVNETKMVEVLKWVRRKYNELVEEYRQDAKFLPTKEFMSKGFDDALQKTFQTGKDLRSLIKSKKVNIIFSAYIWEHAYKFKKGLSIDAYVTAKPPVQYGKNRAQLKCVETADSRFLAMEDGKPFAAQHLALIVLDAAAGKW